MQYILNYTKNHFKFIVVIALILGILVFSGYNLFKDDEEIENKEINLVPKEKAIALSNESDTLEKEEDETLEKEEEVKSLINVDIKGAVLNPGVYELDSNAIVNDVVNLAGGFKEGAYQNGINLSRRVKDEMVIFIYTQEEINEFKNSDNKYGTDDQENVNNTCYAQTYNITECVDNKESIIESTNTDNLEENADNNLNDSIDSKDNLVNINTADVNELITLDGIGSSKAQKIIDYRNQNGNFKSIQELKNVSGIGDKVFDAIKDFITV